MDAITSGAGGVPVAVVDGDMAGDGMQCSYHRYRNNSPGGICAFCLQEKLGKLVSSSSSSLFIASSSSPSFRSDKLASSSTSNFDNNGGVGYNQHQLGFNYSTSQKKKKKALVTSSFSNPHSIDAMVLKRSKSTATPRSGRYFPSVSEDFSPRRRRFWSFVHLSNKKTPRKAKPAAETPPLAVATAAKVAGENGEAVVVDETDSSSPNSSGSNTNTASFGRKVSRSRSVGCGSRSFSGDLFDRISTGFGDCTLRRVESQRDGKHRSSVSRAGDPMKERVRCGGLFSGFMITSSSSSSSSSSYCVSNNSAEPPPAMTPGAGALVNGRHRSWGWALASPMRAFGKPSSSAKDGKNSSKNTNSTPNLAAIPSLLAVRS